MKTIASSSQTGLIALPWDVLVLKAFLLVSTGRPNMSISTYVPTFLSVKNWPEMICGEEKKIYKYIYKKENKIKSASGHVPLYAKHNFTLFYQVKRQKDKQQTWRHLHRECVGDNPIHCALSERIEVLIRPSHKLRFQSVATFPVILVHAQVQLHRQICAQTCPHNKHALNTGAESSFFLSFFFFFFLFCTIILNSKPELLLCWLTDGLEVERYQLTAGVPEELRVIVGWIHSSAFRVDSAQLQLVVSEQSCSGIWLH